MATLSSKLVVSLLDRTGPGSKSVLRNVATMKAAQGILGSSMTATSSAMQGYQRNMGRMQRAMSRMGAGAGIGGLGATALAGGFLNSELKYQEAMNRTRAILNITDKQAFKPHRDLVIELSKRYPATSAEIAKGASELAMAGMSLEEVNQVLEATIQGAMASGETIKTVGMGVTDVVMGLGQALTQGNFLKINNVMAAAATSYAQDYTQFLNGLRKTAPLARMLGLPIERLSGILGILADAGFKAEKGGTALRTSMINMAAPTKKAQAWLQQYKIDLSKFQQTVDTFQLGGDKGAGSLVDFLTDRLNVDASGIQSELARALSDKKLVQDIPKLRQSLASTIADSLGLDDAENRKLIGESVNDFVRSGFKQLDVMGLMRELAAKGFDENAPAMKELFGKRFIAQMAAVINSLRDGTFDRKYDDIFFPRIEGATQRFSKILLEGLPGGLKRLSSAFDAFARSLASSGAMDTVVTVFERLTAGINKMSSTDPQILRAITLALLGLGVVAPIGFALQGIGAGISMIAGAATIAASGVGMLVTALTASNIAAAGAAAWAPMAAAIGLIATRARVAKASMMMLYGIGGGNAVAAAAGISALKAALWGLLIPLRLLKTALLLSPLGAFVAGLTWIYNNASGLGTMFAGIGKGFVENLGPARPIAEGLGAAIKSIVGFIGDLLGPLDASKEQWRSWGETIGAAIAWPIKQIGNLIQLVSDFGSSMSGTAAGRLLGYEGAGAAPPASIAEPADASAAKRQPVKKAAASPAPPATAATKPAEAVAAAADIAKVRATAAQLPAEVRSAMSQVQSIVNGVDFTSAGQRLMQQLAAGIRLGTGEAVSAMSDATQRLKNHVPQSPAKEGPLRGIHRHGLMGEIARGIQGDNAVAAAFSSQMARVASLTDELPGLAKVRPISDSLAERIVVNKGKERAQLERLFGGEGRKLFLKLDSLYANDEKMSPAQQRVYDEMLERIRKDDKHTKPQSTAPNIDIGTGRLTSAMASAAGRARAALDGMPRAGLTAPGAAAGGAGAGARSGAAMGDIIVNVNVAGSNASPAEIADQVGRRVRNAAREYYSDGGF